MGSVPFAVSASERGHSGSRLTGSSVTPLAPNPPFRGAPSSPFFSHPLCLRRSSLRVVVSKAAA